MRPASTLAEARRGTRQFAILALVPFVVALLRWSDLIRTGADTTTRFTVTFPTPHSFISLWSFVNAPTETGDTVASAPLPSIAGLGFGILFVAALAIYVVLTGLLLAGYLGSIDEGLTHGSFEFVANVRRYAKPLTAYEGLSILVLLVLVGGLAVTPALFPVAAIAIFGLGYVTYLAPYLVVVADVGIVAALVQSVSLTLDRSEALVAFLVFLVTGAIISVPVSMLAYGNGVVGGILAAAITAPIGLFASTGFVVVARNLTDGADRITPQSDG